jgi:hypothetical protein
LSCNGVFDKEGGNLLGTYVSEDSTYIYYLDIKDGKRRKLKKGALYPSGEKE